MNLPKNSSRKVPTQSAKSEFGDFKNFLNRKFNPEEPNRIWASDITYLKVGSKWHYLCVVIDLLSDKPNAKLVIDTFSKAYRNRNCPQGLLFHLDRGSQYTSATFRKLLDELNVVQSFSAKGCTFDNAVVEAFFKFLKAEETNRKTYSDLSDL